MCVHLKFLYRCMHKLTIRNVIHNECRSVIISMYFRPSTFLLGFSQRSFVMYFLRPLSIVQIVTFPSWFRDGSPEGPPWAYKYRLKYKLQVLASVLERNKFILYVSRRVVYSYIETYSFSSFSRIWSRGLYRAHVRVV